MTRAFTIEQTEAAFFAKVKGSGDYRECWLWTGATNGKGYGQVRIHNVAYGAHRWLYEHMITDVPPKLDLDHLCRNRACVNPYHLEPVSRAENIRRGILGALKDERMCRRGLHPMLGSYIDSRGRRMCRPCATKALRERRHAAKLEASA